jgi:molybdopterin/thiamine biosynthesis adenylyltransferase
VTRYERHRPLLSDRAWERLTSTPVLIAGVGGLGTNVVMHLARLGPLQIELWDPAEVDAPDLNRQILYGQGSSSTASTPSPRAAVSIVFSRGCPAPFSMRVWRAGTAR